MTRDLFVIVNPAAGGGRAPRQQSAIGDYFRAHGRALEFCESRSPGSVRQQAVSAAAAGYRFVLALGGDGTFHDVAEGVRGTDAIAGFLPAGNGNDIARALGIPRDPIRAADVFLRSQVRAIDLVGVEFAAGRTVHCVCTAGLGLDAEAARLANTRFRRWPGVARYLAGAVTAYFNRTAFDLHAQIDGAEWRAPSLFVVVANGPAYGAGIRIAPRAEVDDGWLDLVLARDLPWRRFLEAIPILLTSGDLRFPEVDRRRCKRVRIEAPPGIRVHGDGEILGETPVAFEIVPGALRVAAPKLRGP